MSVIFYIIGYIVLSISVAYFLKNRKIKAKEIGTYSKAKQIENKIFDRKKHNDYMNNPKFSYMSCNRYNPNSSFHKERIARREKRYVLVEESEFKRLNKSDFEYALEDDENSLISDACAGLTNKYYGVFNTPFSKPNY